MLTIVAFVVALGLLIAVHEYGHYRVAVACGVKVLRFSVGFGRTLYSWKPRKQKPGQDTEFVIGAFPLGGYVKMLDEREGPVPPEERHLAFNTQPLKSRAAIVAAGPAANLLLAIVLYAAVNWYGVEEPKPVLASPVPGSVADQAGLRGGEAVQKAGFEGEDLQPVRSFEELRWLLTRGALDGRDVRLQLDAGREALLALGQISSREADAQLFRRIGIVGPWTPPVIGDVMEGAARRAGLVKGDLVVAVGSTQVVDGQQLREIIRSSVQGGKAAAQAWQVQRTGRTLEIQVQPDTVQDPATSTAIGRIGAFVGSPPEFTTVRYGPVEGLWKGVQRTWEVSLLTLRMMGRMVVGEASLKVLSLGGCDRQERLRRLDGAPAAGRGGGAAVDDDDCTLQRRHPSLWLTFCGCCLLIRPGGVAGPTLIHEKTIQALSRAYSFGHGCHGLRGQRMGG
ncbi:MAG: putative rane protein [Ramlibacter sp.]|nr:putative rane protein [Ramlibacter sp.]